MTMQVQSTSGGNLQESSAAGAESMGKKEFLQLFLAQLSQQDPMNPMDDKAFIAQLAQFTGLEQAMETNRLLEGLQMSQMATANAGATDLIGKQITATGDQISVTETEASPFTFELGGDAQKVTARLLDEGGMVVRSVELGALQEGAHTIDWDGANDVGTTLVKGTYRVEYTAVDAKDGAVAVTAKVKGVVSGVSFESGNAELMVGLIGVKPADVLDVENGDPTDFAQESDG
jgi:flagellar basal-body rod modification protein FlgD